jgi:large subunit ribosomal protein L3
MALELIGRKIKMGNIFREDGTRQAVTFIELVPLTVTQVKRADGPDKYSAIQVGYDPVEGHRLTRAEANHQKGISGKPMRYLTEMRIDNPAEFRVNQKLEWDLVKIGDKVDVIGVSKGRGFAGGMKRYHFRGQSSSHGTSKTHRKPMSGGATDAARVFKGVRKPGHMGDEQVTVKNLEVVMLDGDTGVVAISGAVPGPSGGLIRIVPRATAKSG